MSFPQGVQQFILIEVPRDGGGFIKVFAYPL